MVRDHSSGLLAYPVYLESSKVSFGDDPTPEDSAVGAICSALRAKVNAIVREGFEGWNGTITSGKYKMHVDLTLEKEE